MGVWVWGLKFNPTNQFRTGKGTLTGTRKSVYTVQSIVFSRYQKEGRVLVSILKIDRLYGIEYTLFNAYILSQMI